MPFWCLQFFQKTNENNSTWGTIVVRSNLFVHFLEEFKIPKRHFEINWPLVAELRSANRHKSWERRKVVSDILHDLLCKSIWIDLLFLYKGYNFLVRLSICCFIYERLVFVDSLKFFFVELKLKEPLHRAQNT